MHVYIECASQVKGDQARDSLGLELLLEFKGVLEVWATG
jgi:hypothetical protein